jgi:minor extracellular serine protease Vpr
VRRLFTPLAVGAAAWLLVACGGGGGDAPAAASSTDRSGASASASNSASSRAFGSAYRVRVDDATVTARLDSRLRTARGPVDVWVSLEQNSVAAQRASLADAAGMTDRAMAKGSSMLREGARQHRQAIAASQAGLSGQLSALGAKELARVQKAHNAIAVRIDAAQLKQVAALQGVAKVRPVLTYQLDLAETVPYVGGTAVQASGRDGTGVKVAVIDSGIDYTHVAFGGAGTAEAYAAAWGTSTTDPKNTTTDGLFPTAKVVAGFDFVGEAWPNCAPGVDCRTEDPDPIDLEGHGTHVADIIAGKKGMAPGASLVAIKACSAVSSSCNGIALIKAVEYAIDPNGDGDTEDAVDVINMSLGSNYGQVEDDLTQASTNAVKVGVVIVASAGNGANRPYIVGSPSIAPGVISVAQTAVPSAKAVPLVVNAPTGLAGVYGNTATVDWAPIGAGVTGDVVFFGRGCPAGSVAGQAGADPVVGNPSGKIALIDRGACGVSLKVDNAVKAGATGVLIGLVAAGDAVSFSNAGGTDFKPTLVIQQALATAIKNSTTTVNVSLSEASSIPLVGSMASTSSRGPSVSEQTIKPEIGAPGASISAIAGSGTGTEAFGGTSGAAPMVSGAVALLVQAYPNRSPRHIKAMLMNSANTAVFTNPALVPGELAPVTRIGAGELRADKAIGLDVVAFNRDSESAALSFGALEVERTMTVSRTLRLRNFGHQDKRFSITPSFRYADDEASGAVRVITRSSVRVAGHGTEDVEVRLVIDPSKLLSWTLNGGSLGGSGAALNGPEFDGYLTLTSGSEKLSVPWHVLPRKAADASAELVHRGDAHILRLRNRGTADSEYDAFSLAGVSKRVPRTDLPKPGDNFAVVDMRSVGVRYLPGPVIGAPFDVLEFAINTNGRRAHPNYPAEFNVEIDTDGDGVADYLVFNAESGGFGASGQNTVFLADLKAGGPGLGQFFTDADLNSGNVILSVLVNNGPGSMTLAPGATIGFAVRAFDNYFTGNETDAIEGMRFTPSVPRYGLVGGPFGSLAARSGGTVGIVETAVTPEQSTESGVLLMYRRNADKEANAIRVQ